MEPSNPLISALMTDSYQITMSYAYYRDDRHERPAVFDLFFRSCPFDGEYAVCAGLGEAVRLLDDFGFTDEDVSFVRETLIPDGEDGFFDWLRSVDASEVRVDAVAEGSVVFPRTPLMRVSGPLGVTQLLETTLLNLVNFPSLLTTKSARIRRAAGDAALLEFGLRRAQGPDGAMSASRYSYVGGFDATSNVRAGKMFGIPIKGTHAHSFVQGYIDLDDLEHTELETADGQSFDLRERAAAWREELGFERTNDGELAAFIAYGRAFPQGFLALVDTYDTLDSGVPNFLIVAAALREAGYESVGIRLDSGDLPYLSREARAMFEETADATGLRPEELTIVASNDLDEETILSFEQQGHEIDAFGIGTRLATCFQEPAFGGVYKLVQIGDSPRLKLSESVEKMPFPGRKATYRLYGEDGYALVDLLQLEDEEPPRPGEPIVCRHPFEESKRVRVVPARVEAMLECVWDGGRTIELPTLDDAKQRVRTSLEKMRPDHLRPDQPTPYKVSLSEDLYRFFHDLWMEEAPLQTLQ